MAKFNAAAFFASKLRNAKTTVSYSGEDISVRLSLDGLPKAATAEGVASLAKSQATEVRTSTAAVETEGGLRITRRGTFTQKDASEFIGQAEKAGMAEAKGGATTQETVTAGNGHG